MGMKGTILRGKVRDKGKGKQGAKGKGRQRDGSSVLFYRIRQKNRPFVSLCPLSPPSASKQAVAILFMFEGLMIVLNHYKVLKMLVAQGLAIFHDDKSVGFLQQRMVRPNLASLIFRELIHL